LNRSIPTIGLTTVGNDDTDTGLSALEITAPILIDGSAAPGLTIARSPTVATPDMRVFYVASSGNFTLNDVTILGGQDLSTAAGGGGLLNSGTVTLTGDSFLANSASSAGGFDKAGETAMRTREEHQVRGRFGRQCVWCAGLRQLLLTQIDQGLEVVGSNPAL
jgi:hypothetical protein